MKIDTCIQAGTVLLMMAVLSGCYKPEKNVVEKQLGWSTFEPLSIPYRQRVQQRESGNLILNPSFEEGRVFLDSALATFNLKGWKSIGEHVEWLDTADAGVQKDEVSQGRYAVKISRSVADETEDRGVGIISDFIKVIPGNYTFSFDIRLKDIVSNKVRLGTKIFDAINIRVFFYDKNKIQVSPEMYFPAENKKIDNSFKGFPYSNFRKIDSLDWKRSYGRAHHYPFSTGDIPSEARYVKILFGLKGTGEMWIDNVDFRYSKWNFSTLERMKAYTGKRYTKPELIIPTPQHIGNNMDTLSLFDMDSSRFPLIIIPQYSRKEHRYAAQLIKNSMVELIPDSILSREKDPVKIIRYPDARYLKAATVVINIGETKFHALHRELMPYGEIQDRSQAYFLHHVADEFQYVYLEGNEPVGIIYAARSFMQLIEERTAALHFAPVVDYPDYRNRSYIIPFELADTIGFNSHSILNRLVDARFNHVYLGPQTEDDEKKYLNALRKFRSEVNYSGAFEFGVLLDPYIGFKGAEPGDIAVDEPGEIFLHSSNRDLWQLNKKCRLALQYGASGLVILSDHYPRQGADFYDFPLYHPGDKKRFINLQNAHAHLINYLIKGLQLGDTHRFYFSSPWNNLEYINKSFGAGRIYYRELMYQIPGNINLLWSGTTHKTYEIDEIDMKRMQLITGQHPILLDNTLYYEDSLIDERFHTTYPGKVRLLSFFQPYEINVPASFNTQTQGEVFIHQHPEDEFDLIQMYTAADYLWNSDSYNPELVLWKILLKKYGREFAVKLLEFNDYYYELKEISLLTYRPNFQKDYGKKISNLRAQMEASLEEMTGMTDQQQVISLLRHNMNQLNSRLK